MKKFDKSSAVVSIISLVLSLTGPISVLAAGPAAVNLSAVSNFAILAKTGVSNTGSTYIVGDVGVSPAQATYLTGFGLSLSAMSAFSTSALVNGKIYAPGYADPTPANISVAVSAMETAYTDAAGRTNPTATELGAGNIGGMTLAPGLYKWSTGLTIPTDVTLTGAANDVWIFQIAQNFNISAATKIVLSGGAQASNIFWVVGGQTTIGTTAVFNGNILDQTTIVLNTGATLNGRALAQAAVTLDANSVTIPSATAAVSVSVSTTPAPTNNNSTYTPYTGSSNYNTAPATTNQNSGTVNANTSTMSSASASVSAFGQLARMITVSLAQGGRGASVTTLQQFLISQNKGSSAQALAKVGASAYFGALTRAALAEFQASVGISPALGNFGPITRAYISAHY